MENQCDQFIEDKNKSILITIIDGRTRQQTVHIPFVRRLIDRKELLLKKSPGVSPKYFILLLHSTGQELNHRSCFPSTFLYDWDYWFVDSSSSGGTVHLQKMLEIFLSKLPLRTIPKELEVPSHNFKNLFDDCLWDFCSRFHIPNAEMSEALFETSPAREFYQRETTTSRRVECLKEIFHKAKLLRQHIINIYHEKVTMQGDALRKSCNSIYQICRDTLCGKQLTGFAEVLQARIRASFSHFVSAILKFMVDDYGLEALVVFSQNEPNYTKPLALIDYSALTKIDQQILAHDSWRDRITFNNRFSCVPRTPLFYLLRERIMLFVEKTKTKLILQNQNQDDGKKHIIVPSLIRWISL